MGIFRQFPYSNFHELNLDWFLKHFKELQAAWQEYANKMDLYIDDLEAFKDFFETWTGTEITETVENWLETHPEAITINWFVMPSMYGAVGDGQNDDTAAFKAALNSGKQVVVPTGRYNLTEDIFTDEAVLFDDKGTYTNKKLVCSKVITDNAVNVGILESQSLTALGLRGLQGCVYNTRRRTLILTSDLNANGDTPIIVEVDPVTFNTLNSVRSTALGHINDITYNPDTNIYYCVTGVNNGEIVPISSDLSVQTPRIIEGISEPLRQISYDPDNKIYYLTTYGGIFISDENFNVIKQLSSGYGEMLKYVYNNITGGYYQNSLVYRGQFLSLFWLWAEAGHTSYARIGQYNYITGVNSKIYDIPMALTNDEPEALVLIDDDFYVYGYIGDRLTIRKLTFEPSVLSVPKNIINFQIETFDATNGTTISNAKMYGDTERIYFEFTINAVSQIPAGSSYSFKIRNANNLRGLLLGWSGSTPVLGYLQNNQVIYRAFDVVPASWSVAMRGVLVTMP